MKNKSKKKKQTNKQTNKNKQAKKLKIQTNKNSITTLSG